MKLLLVMGAVLAVTVSQSGTSVCVIVISSLLR